MVANRRRGGPLCALLALVAIIAGVVVVAAPASTVTAAVPVPFAKAFSTQDNGAVSSTGNSQMSCPTAANNCSTARAATPVTSGSNSAIDNNSFTMSFLDQDADASTSNSTSADLNLPSGSVVLYARLVWGGRLFAGTNGSAALANPDVVKFRTPVTGYTSQTATTYVHPFDDTTSNFGPYQASRDVTALVQAGGNGTYWVADMKAATGQDRYAGWSLVVAYRNPSLPLRDLSIFEGFANVNTVPGNTTVDIPVSGFLTPAAGTVNASVGFVTWEGDRGLTGESVSLNGVTLSNVIRPANNYLNSGITEGGANIAARNANNLNNFGVDIANTVANGVLPNSATSTTVTMTTNSDFYYPGIVTTQIDLYTPAFNAVSKTVTNLSGHSTAQVGDTLQYKLSFTNTGQDFADNSVITDLLAANQSYVPGTINVTTSPGGVNNGAKTDAAGDDIAEYDAANRTVRVRVGTGATVTGGGILAPNDTVSVQFNATLLRASAGTSIDNNAVLSYRARTIAKNFTFIGNVVSTPVTAIADLSVTKSSSPTTVNAGGTVQYPVTVTNNGPSAATGVSMVDTLPTGVSFVSAAAPPGASCANSGQQVTCTSATLANGAPSTFTVTATVGAALPAGAVVNSATVSSSTSDDVTTNNSASATTAITRSADLVAGKTGPAGTITAGQAVTYTVTATNNGPSTATNVRLTDQIPVGAVATPAPGVVAVPGAVIPTCVMNGTTASCTIASLGPNQTITAMVSYTLGSGFSGASVSNAATVSADTPDPSSANNTATVSNTVARSADVVLTKSVSSPTAAAGTGVTYTLTVSNSGLSDAQAVTVADPAVAGLTIISAAPSRGTCTITAGNLSCDIGLLSPASSATIIVKADVAPDFAGTTLVNAATATSTTTDPNPANNTNITSSLTVTKVADVAIVKTGPATITANTDQTYVLTITNTGPSQAIGVTAADVLGSGLTFVPGGGNCTAAGTTVTCAVGTLAVNQTVTRTFVVHAPGTVPDPLANTATITSTSTDPNAANNSSTFTSSAQNLAEISVTKAQSPTTLVADGPLLVTSIV